MVIGSDVTMLIAGPSETGIRNNGQLINNGSILFEGDKSLVNDGVINNNGTISIPSNFSLSGNSEFEGEGFLTLAGESLQNINSAAAITVRNLRVIGGGEKVINQTININGTLELEDGILNLQSSNGSGTGVIQIQQTGQIVGGNPLSYIDGQLIAIKDTGDIYFPLGKDGLFMPITLNEIQTSDNLSLLAEIKFEPEIQSTSGAGLQNIMLSPYWDIRSVNPNPDGDLIDFTCSNVSVAFTDALDLSAYSLSGDRITLAKSRGITEEFVNMKTTTVSTNNDGITEVISAIGISREFPIITLASEVSIIIRNMITANGDDVNDGLFIENLPDPFEVSNKLVILNRLGEKIFEQNDYSNEDPWIPDDDIPAGDYIVVISFTNFNQQPAPQLVSVVKER